MAISIDRLASPLAGRSDRGTTAAAAECAQVARSAGVLSMAILLSRMSGLVREVFMAHEFGAGFSYDAFLLGFRIPNLTRDLFAEGALSAAFIPAFTGVLKKEGRAAAEELSNVVATATMTVVAVVCVVGMIFSPQIVGLLAPGFASVPGKFALTVHMTRLMFPFLLFIALAAQATGILNSSGKFGIPGIASVFFNVGSVLVAFVLGFVLGPFIGISRIDGMAYGTTIGGLLQLAWQMPWVFRQGFRFKPAFNWSHPGLRLIFQMMLPAIVTSAAVQINVIVNSCFASELSDPVRGPNGPVSWLAYAFRLVHLPLGIFGVAIASAMLPSVSRSAAAGNLDEFRRTVARSLAMMLTLTVPASVVLVVLSRPLIGAIYQGGRFGAYDTEQTALALCCYAAGLGGYAAARLLAPAFYALSDARTPMYASMLAVALNIAIPLLLIREFGAGFASLAVTTSVAAIVECVVLAEMLRRKLGGLEGRYLLDRVKRIAAASLLMAVPVAFACYELNQALGSSRITYMLELAVCAPIFGVSFIAAFRLLRVPELDVVLDMFTAPVRNRLFGRCA